MTKVFISQPMSGKTERAFADSMSYTSAEIELCVTADIPLEVWTINDVGTMLALPNYISGVTSDIINAGYELYKEYIVKALYSNHRQRIMVN